MIRIRSAKKEDLPHLIKLLSQLTTVGNPSPELISESIYNHIYVAYIKFKYEEIILGAISLLIEPKIIHKGRSVGHIEDLVVDSEYRNLGIGKTLVEYAISIANVNKCYKIILYCDEKNINFYIKSGFKTKGVSMRYDLQ